MHVLSLLLVVMLGVTLLVPYDLAQDEGVIRTSGDALFSNDGLLHARLGFDPPRLVTGTGKVVTFVHDDLTRATHTITLVQSNDMPRYFEELFDGCMVCQGALDAHGGHRNRELSIDRGEPGMDLAYDYDPFWDTMVEGDSWLLLPGEKISIPVSARPGSTLTYFCAIHPWMQGEIAVEPAPPPEDSPLRELVRTPGTSGRD